MSLLVYHKDGFTCLKKIQISNRTSTRIGSLVWNKISLALDFGLPANFKDCGPTNTHTDAGNDNALRPKLASGDEKHKILVRTYLRSYNRLDTMLMKVLGLISRFSLNS